MFLDSFFKTEKTYDALIEKKVQTKNATTGMLEDSWSTVQTVKAIFWRGSMADSFVSAQFRPIISGVALVKPSDITTTIPTNGRITLTYGVLEIGKFAIIAADDIAQQGEVLVIPLQQYKG